MTTRTKYDQAYAFSYDTDITTIFYANRTADTHAWWFLPYLKAGMTLLDCGCGSGSITIGLSKAVEPGRVIGVDISETEIERAGERANEKSITSIQFEVGDLCHLDFSDNSFDALFSHNVLEHIPEHKRALREMYRLLRPGGVIGIRDTDIGGFLYAPDETLLERHKSLTIAYYDQLGAHPIIARSLGTLLYETGFTEVKMSASYEVYGDLESRRFMAQIYADTFDDAHIVDEIIRSGLATADELKDMKNAWLTWQEIPGAFHARSHCEVVGRKAK